MKTKWKVGILGATGMVGQRFIRLLHNHPWFDVVTIGASPRSTGKTYNEAASGRWSQAGSIPTHIRDMKLVSIEDIDAYLNTVDFVFSAFSADKEYTRLIEERYAAAGLPVVSNNSAHRWTPDVPMVIPEINADHFDLIEIQQKQRGWSNGFIVVKPNCSIQSYVPLLHVWREFVPMQVIVSTYQALSGAGKTLDSWPEMEDNVIPYIGGEEAKSEQEPLKIFGTVDGTAIRQADEPMISANCIRVPVSDGHLTTIHIGFDKHPTYDDLIACIRNFENPLLSMDLPSAPHPFIRYFDEVDRPQTRLDRGYGGGMAITAGRLRPDGVLDWKCVALSHNTVRGAAGGSVLNAEYLVRNNYIPKR